MGTIVSKGQSGGHTAMLPESDASHHTKAQMQARLDVFMGERAAEEIIFGKEKVTGGASSDLAQATRIATSYVKLLGMSEKYGLRVTHGEEEQMMSESTKNLMDAEINRLLNESYKNATGILKGHRRELDLLADALLKYETLDSDDIKAIIDGNPKKLAHKNTLTSSSKILLRIAEILAVSQPETQKISVQVILEFLLDLYLHNNTVIDTFLFQCLLYKWCKSTSPL